MGQTFAESRSISTIEEPQPMTARGRFQVRWLGWALVALIAGGFIYLNRGEWREIGAAAREARPLFLLLAAALQVCWLVAFAATFWSGMLAVDVRLPFGRTLPLAWACNFVNMVVKSGGMSGMALFIRAARPRGYEASRATLGYLLTIAIGYVGFLLLLAVALPLLWLNGDLRRLELIAAGATFVVLAGLILWLLWVVQSPARVGRAHQRIARVVNGGARLLRRGQLIDPHGAERAAAEAGAVTALVRGRPARLTPAVLTDIAKEVSAVAVLYTVLLAFDNSASVSLALVAYTLTILFSYVSIVPSGLGLVEVSLTALLIRTGVTPAAAALTTVVYRLFQFWMPFLVGAAATRFSGGR